jgi:hypothetical protein
VLVKSFKMSLNVYNHSLLKQHVSATLGPSSGNIFVIGETTALYTLSSVLLGTSLFLFINFFRRILLCIFLAAISDFYVVLCVYNFSAVLTYKVSVPVEC